MCVEKNGIEKEIDFIFEQTSMINACIVFYKQIIDIKDEKPNIFNNGKNFLNSVSTAYDYLIICKLSKIFDKKGQKGNIFNLVEKSKNNNLIRAATESEIQKLLFNSELIISKIKTYRDKYFAHTDEKYFRNTEILLKEQKFDLDDFLKLNNILADILSKIKSDINNESYILKPNLLSGYDLYKLISDR